MIDILLEVIVQLILRAHWWVYSLGGFSEKAA